MNPIFGAMKDTIVRIAIFSSISMYVFDADAGEQLFLPDHLHAICHSRKG